MYPQPVSFDEGVCQLDELSHKGCEGDFGGFSGTPKFVADRLEVRVEAHRDESRHVERVAQVFASALDECLAVPLSGLARHRCQTGETGHLFAIHGSDLWHLDQHGCGRDGPDAGD